MSGLRFGNSSNIGTLLLVQIALVGISSVLMLMLGSVQALSWFIGGAISIVSNGYLAFKLISRRSADPNRVLGMMYAGEIGKIVITATLFAIIFATQAWVQPLTLFLGYTAALLAHWLSAIVAGNRN
ncbi:MAG: ATP synthase subunit I [Gammaproteobacteria bacterium]|nr:ATP synthase subunit I [Gammaproteobacteria bacterium]